MFIEKYSRFISAIKILVYFKFTNFMMTSEFINPLSYTPENHNWDDWSFVEQWLAQEANRVPNASNGASNLGPVFHQCQRRVRTDFTTEQLNILENVFSETQFVKKPACVYLAWFLGVTWKKVRVWFQNRRMREKRNKKNKEYKINNEPTNQPAYCKAHYHYLLPVNKKEIVTSQSILTQENYDRQICSSNEPTTTNYGTYLSSADQNTDLDTNRSPARFNNVTGQSVLILENYDRQRYSSNETTKTYYDTSMLCSYQYTDLDTSGSPSSLINVTGQSVLKQENYDRQRCSSNEPTTTNYETCLLSPYQYTDLDTIGSPSNLDFSTDKSVLAQENYDRYRCSSNESTTTNYKTSLSSPYQYTDLDTSESPYSSKSLSGQSPFTFQEQPRSNESTPMYSEKYEQRHYNVHVPYKSENFSDIEIDESSSSLEGSYNLEGHSNKPIQQQHPVISTNKKYSQGNITSQPRTSSEEREQTQSVERLIKEIIKEDPYLTPQHESSTLFNTQSAPINHLSYPVNRNFDDQYYGKGTVSFATNVYGSEWIIKHEISDAT